MAPSIIPKSLIRYFFISQLKRFIEISEKDVSLQLSSGQLNIDHVRLRPDALESLGVPFAVSDGLIQSMSIHIPITPTSLYQIFMNRDPDEIEMEKITINLVDITFCVEPLEFIEFNVNAKEEIEKAFARKMKDVEKELQILFERRIKQFGILSLSSSPTRAANVSRLLKRLLTINVTNLHIRYIDRKSRPEKPFHVGIKIGRLHFGPCGEDCCSMQREHVPRGEKAHDGLSNPAISSASSQFPQVPLPTSIPLEGAKYSNPPFSRVRLLHQHMEWTDMSLYLGSLPPPTIAEKIVLAADAASSVADSDIAHEVLNSSTGVTLKENPEFPADSKIDTTAGSSLSSHRAKSLRMKRMNTVLKTSASDFHMTSKVLASTRGKISTTIQSTGRLDSLDSALSSFSAVINDIEITLKASEVAVFRSLKDFSSHISRISVYKHINRPSDRRVPLLTELQCRQNREYLIFCRIRAALKNMKENMSDPESERRLRAQKDIALEASLELHDQVASDKEVDNSSSSSTSESEYENQESDSSPTKHDLSFGDYQFPLDERRIWSFDSKADSGDTDLEGIPAPIDPYISLSPETRRRISARARSLWRFAYLCVIRDISTAVKSVSGTSNSESNVNVTGNVYGSATGPAAGMSRRAQRYVQLYALQLYYSKRKARPLIVPPVVLPSFTVISNNNFIVDSSGRGDEGSSGPIHSSKHHFGGKEGEKEKKSRFLFSRKKGEDSNSSVGHSEYKEGDFESDERNKWKGDHPEYSRMKKRPVLEWVADIKSAHIPAHSFYANFEPRFVSPSVLKLVASMKSAAGERGVSKGSLSKGNEVDEDDTEGIDRLLEEELSSSVEIAAATAPTAPQGPSSAGEAQKGNHVPDSSANNQALFRDLTKASTSSLAASNATAMANSVELLLKRLEMGLGKEEIILLRQQSESLLVAEHVARLQQARVETAFRLAGCTPRGLSREAVQRLKSVYSNQRMGYGAGSTLLQLRNATAVTVSTFFGSDSPPGQVGFTPEMGLFGSFAVAAAAAASLQLSSAPRVGLLSSMLAIQWLARHNSVYASSNTTNPILLNDTVYRDWDASSDSFESSRKLKNKKEKEKRKADKYNLSDSLKERDSSRGYEELPGQWRLHGPWEHRVAPESARVNYTSIPLSPTTTNVVAILPQNPGFERRAQSLAQAPTFLRELLPAVTVGTSSSAALADRDPYSKALLAVPSRPQAYTHPGTGPGSHQQLDPNSASKLNEQMLHLRKSNILNDNDAGLGPQLQLVCSRVFSGQLLRMQVLDEVSASHQQSIADDELRVANVFFSSYSKKKRDVHSMTPEKPPQPAPAVPISLQLDTSMPTRTQYEEEQEQWSVNGQHSETKNESLPPSNDSVATMYLKELFSATADPCRHWNPHNLLTVPTSTGLSIMLGLHPLSVDFYSESLAHSHLHLNEKDDRRVQGNAVESQSVHKIEWKTPPAPLPEVKSYLRSASNFAVLAAQSVTSSTLSVSVKPPPLVSPAKSQSKCDSPDITSQTYFCPSTNVHRHPSTQARPTSLHSNSAISELAPSTLFLQWICDAMSASTFFRSESNRHRLLTQCEGSSTFGTCGGGKYSSDSLMDIVSHCNCGIGDLFDQLGLSRLLDLPLVPSDKGTATDSIGLPSCLNHALSVFSSLSPRSEAHLGLPLGFPLMQRRLVVHSVRLSLIKETSTPLTASVPETSERIPFLELRLNAMDADISELAGVSRKRYALTVGSAVLLGQTPSLQGVAGMVRNHTLGWSHVDPLFRSLIPEHPEPMSELASLKSLPLSAGATLPVYMYPTVSLRSLFADETFVRALRSFFSLSTNAIQSIWRRTQPNNTVPVFLELGDTYGDSLLRHCSDTGMNSSRYYKTGLNGQKIKSCISEEEELLVMRLCNTALLCTGEQREQALETLALLFASLVASPLAALLPPPKELSLLQMGMSFFRSQPTGASSSVAASATIPGSSTAYGDGDKKKKPSSTYSTLPSVLSAFTAATPAILNQLALLIDSSFHQSADNLDPALNNRVNNTNTEGQQNLGTRRGSTSSITGALVVHFLLAYGAHLRASNPTPHSTALALFSASLHNSLHNSPNSDISVTQQSKSSGPSLPQPDMHPFNPVDVGPEHLEGLLSQLRSCSESSLLKSSLVLLFATSFWCNRHRMSQVTGSSDSICDSNCFHVVQGEVEVRSLGSFGGTVDDLNSNITVDENNCIPVFKNVSKLYARFNGASHPPAPPAVSAVSSAALFETEVIPVFSTLQNVGEKSNFDKSLYSNTFSLNFSRESDYNDRFQVLYDSLPSIQHMHGSLYAGSGVIVAQMNSSDAGSEYPHFSYFSVPIAATAAAIGESGLSNLSKLPIYRRGWWAQGRVQKLESSGPNSSRETSSDVGKNRRDWEAGSLPCLLPLDAIDVVYESQKLLLENSESEKSQIVTNFSSSKLTLLTPLPYELQVQLGQLLSVRLRHRTYLDSNGLRRNMIHQSSSDTLDDSSVLQRVRSGPSFFMGPSSSLSHDPERLSIAVGGVLSTLGGLGPSNKAFRKALQSPKLPSQSIGKHSPSSKSRRDGEGTHQSSLSLENNAYSSDDDEFASDSSGDSLSDGASERFRKPRLSSTSHYVRTGSMNDVPRLHLHSTFPLVMNGHELASAIKAHGCTPGPWCLPSFSSLPRAHAHLRLLCERGDSPLAVSSSSPDASPAIRRLMLPVGVWGGHVPSSILPTPAGSLFHYVADREEDYVVGEIFIPSGSPVAFIGALLPPIHMRFDHNNDTNSQLNSGISRSELDNLWLPLFALPLHVLEALRSPLLALPQCRTHPSETSLVSSLNSNSKEKKSEKQGKDKLREDNDSADVWVPSLPPLPVAEPSGLFAAAEAPLVQSALGQNVYRKLVMAGFLPDPSAPLEPGLSGQDVHRVVSGRIPGPHGGAVFVPELLGGVPLGLDLVEEIQRSASLHLLAHTSLVLTSTAAIATVSPSNSVESPYCAPFSVVTASPRSMRLFQAALDSHILEAKRTISQTQVPLSHQNSAWNLILNSPLLSSHSKTVLAGGELEKIIGRSSPSYPTPNLVSVVHSDLSSILSIRVGALRGTVHPCAVRAVSEFVRIAQREWGSGDLSLSTPSTLQVSHFAAAAAASTAMLRRRLAGLWAASILRDALKAQEQKNLESRRNSNANLVGFPDSDEDTEDADGFVGLDGSSVEQGDNFKPKDQSMPSIFSEAADAAIGSHHPTMSASASSSKEDRGLALLAEFGNLEFLAPDYEENEEFPDDTIAESAEFWAATMPHRAKPRIEARLAEDSLKEASPDLRRVTSSHFRRALSHDTDRLFSKRTAGSALLRVATEAAAVLFPKSPWRPSTLQEEVLTAAVTLSISQPQSALESSVSQTGDASGTSGHSTEQAVLSQRDLLRLQAAMGRKATRTVSFSLEEVTLYVPVVTSSSVPSGVRSGSENDRLLSLCPLGLPSSVIVSPVGAASRDNLNSGQQNWSNNLEDFDLDSAGRTDFATQATHMHAVSTLSLTLGPLRLENLRLRGSRFFSSLPSYSGLTSDLAVHYSGLCGRLNGASVSINHGYLVGLAGEKQMEDDLSHTLIEKCHLYLPVKSTPILSLARATMANLSLPTKSVLKIPQGVVAVDVPNIHVTVGRSCIGAFSVLLDAWTGVLNPKDALKANDVRIDGTSYGNADNSFILGYGQSFASLIDGVTDIHNFDGIPDTHSVVSDTALFEDMMGSNIFTSERFSSEDEKKNTQVPLLTPSMIAYNIQTLPASARTLFSIRAAGLTVKIGEDVDSVDPIKLIEPPENEELMKKCTADFIDLEFTLDSEQLGVDPAQGYMPGSRLTPELGPKSRKPHIYPPSVPGQNGKVVLSRKFCQSDPSRTVAHLFFPSESSSSVLVSTIIGSSSTGGSKSIELSEKLLQTVGTITLRYPFPKDSFNGSAPLNRSNGLELEFSITGVSLDCLRTAKTKVNTSNISTGGNDTSVNGVITTLQLCVDDIALVASAQSDSVAQRSQSSSSKVTRIFGISKFPNEGQVNMNSDSSSSLLEMSRECAISIGLSTPGGAGSTAALTDLRVDVGLVHFHCDSGILESSLALFSRVGSVMTAVRNDMYTLASMVVDEEDYEEASEMDEEEDDDEVEQTPKLNSNNEETQHESLPKDSSPDGVVPKIHGAYVLTLPSSFPILPDSARALQRQDVTLKLEIKRGSVPAPSLEADYTSSVPLGTRSSTISRSLPLPLAFLPDNILLSTNPNNKSGSRALLEASTTSRHFKHLDDLRVRFLPPDVSETKDIGLTAASSAASNFGESTVIPNSNSPAAALVSSFSQEETLYRVLLAFHQDRRNAVFVAARTAVGVTDPVHSNPNSSPVGEDKLHLVDLHCSVRIAAVAIRISVENSSLSTTSSTASTQELHLTMGDIRAAFVADSPTAVLCDLHCGANTESIVLPVPIIHSETTVANNSAIVQAKLLRRALWRCAAASVSQLKAVLASPTSLIFSGITEDYCQSEPQILVNSHDKYWTGVKGGQCLLVIDDLHFLRHWSDSIVDETTSEFSVLHDLPTQPALILASLRKAVLLAEPAPQFLPKWAQQRYYTDSIRIRVGDNSNISSSNENSVSTQSEWITGSSLHAHLVRELLRVEALRPTPNYQELNNRKIDKMGTRSESPTSFTALPRHMRMVGRVSESLASPSEVIHHFWTHAAQLLANESLDKNMSATQIIPVLIEVYTGSSPLLLPRRAVDLTLADTSPLRTVPDPAAAKNNNATKMEGTKGNPKIQISRGASSIRGDSSSVHMGPNVSSRASFVSARSDRRSAQFTGSVSSRDGQVELQSPIMDIPAYNLFVDITLGGTRICTDPISALSVLSSLNSFMSIRLNGKDDTPTAEGTSIPVIRGEKKWIHAGIHMAQLVASIPSVATGVVDPRRAAADARALRDVIRHRLKNFPFDVQFSDKKRIIIPASHCSGIVLPHSEAIFGGVSVVFDSFTHQFDRVALPSTMKTSHTSSGKFGAPMNTSNVSFNQMASNSSKFGREKAYSVNGVSNPEVETPIIENSYGKLGISTVSLRTSTLFVMDTQVDPSILLGDSSSSVGKDPLNVREADSNDADLCDIAHILWQIELATIPLLRIQGLGLSSELKEPHITRDDLNEVNFEDFNSASSFLRGSVRKSGVTSSNAIGTSRPLKSSNPFDVDPLLSPTFVETKFPEDDALIYPGLAQLLVCGDSSVRDAVHSSLQSLGNRSRLVSVASVRKILRQRSLSTSLELLDTLLTSNGYPALRGSAVSQASQLRLLSGAEKDIFRPWRVLIAPSLPLGLPLVSQKTLPTAVTEPLGPSLSPEVVDFDANADSSHSVSQSRRRGAPRLHSSSVQNVEDAILRFIATSTNPYSVTDEISNQDTSESGTLIQTHAALLSLPSPSWLLTALPVRAIVHSPFLCSVLDAAVYSELDMEKSVKASRNDDGNGENSTSLKSLAMLTTFSLPLEPIQGSDGALFEADPSSGSKRPQNPFFSSSEKDSARKLSSGASQAKSAVSKGSKVSQGALSALRSSIFQKISSNVKENTSVMRSTGVPNDAQQENNILNTGRTEEIPQLFTSQTTPGASGSVVARLSEALRVPSRARVPGSGASVISRRSGQFSSANSVAASTHATLNANSLNSSMYLRSNRVPVDFNSFTNSVPLFLQPPSMLTVVNTGSVTLSQESNVTSLSSDSKTANMSSLTSTISGENTSDIAQQVKPESVGSLSVIVNGLSMTYFKQWTEDLKVHVAVLKSLKRNSLGISNSNNTNFDIIDGNIPFTLGTELTSNSGISSPLTSTSLYDLCSCVAPRPPTFDYTRVLARGLRILVPPGSGLPSALLPQMPGPKSHLKSTDLVNGFNNSPKSDGKPPLSVIVISIQCAQVDFQLTSLQLPAANTHKSESSIITPPSTSSEKRDSDLGRVCNFPFERLLVTLDCLKLASAAPMDLQLVAPKSSGASRSSVNVIDDNVRIIALQGPPLHGIISPSLIPGVTEPFTSGTINSTHSSPLSDDSVIDSIMMDSTFPLTDLSQVNIYSKQLKLLFNSVWGVMNQSSTSGSNLVGLIGSNSLRSISNGMKSSDFLDFLSTFILSYSPEILRLDSISIVLDNIIGQNNRLTSPVNQVLQVTVPLNGIPSSVNTTTFPSTIGGIGSGNSSMPNANPLNFMPPASLNTGSSQAASNFLGIENPSNSTVSISGLVRHLSTLTDTMKVNVKERNSLVRLPPVPAGETPMIVNMSIIPITTSNTCNPVSISNSVNLPVLGMNVPGIPFLNNIPTIGFFIRAVDTLPLINSLSIGQPRPFQYTYPGTNSPSSLLSGNVSIVPGVSASSPSEGTLSKRSGQRGGIADKLAQTLDHSLRSRILLSVAPLLRAIVAASPQDTVRSGVFNLSENFTKVSESVDLRVTDEHFEDDILIATESFSRLMPLNLVDEDTARSLNIAENSLANGVPDRSIVTSDDRNVNLSSNGDSSSSSNSSDIDSDEDSTSGESDSSTSENHHSRAGTASSDSDLDHNTMRADISSNHLNFSRHQRKGGIPNVSGVIAASKIVKEDDSVAVRPVNRRDFKAPTLVEKDSASIPQASSLSGTEKTHTIATVPKLLARIKARAVMSPAETLARTLQSTNLLKNGSAKVWSKNDTSPETVFVSLEEKGNFEDRVKNSSRSTMPESFVSSSKSPTDLIILLKAVFQRGIHDRDERNISLLSNEALLMKIRRAVSSFGLADALLIAANTLTDVSKLYCSRKIGTSSDFDFADLFEGAVNDKSSGFHISSTAMGILEGVDSQDYHEWSKVLSLLMALVVKESTPLLTFKVISTTRRLDAFQAQMVAMSRDNSDLRLSIQSTTEQLNQLQQRHSAALSDASKARILLHDVISEAEEHVIRAEQLKSLLDRLKKQQDIQAKIPLKKEEQISLLKKFLGIPEWMFASLLTMVIMFFIIFSFPNLFIRLLSYFKE